MSTKPTRREVLVGGAAVAAGVALLPACGPTPPEGEPPPPTVDPQPYDHGTPTAFAPESLPEDDALFALGVQSGAMTNAGALVWTHVETAAALRLRVWRDSPNAGEVILVTDVAVTPDADGYVKTPAGTLAPATRYHYGFFVEENGALVRRSTLGRFRTAFPDDWKEPFTVCATTCTNWKFQPYVALEAMAKEEMDAFIHLGDMSYNDGAYYLADYRAKWRATLQDPGYRAVLPAAGMYITWDDHEFTNNYDPEALAVSDPSLLPTAKQAFFETLAVERGPNDRLWRSYRWGKSAELFILDSRSERLPSTATTDHPIYLGEEQMAWFKQALVDSPAHFKVVLNSVPMANFPPPLWGGQADRWQGYDAQRRELLQFITDHKLTNVWFLSGDFHLGLVCRLEKDGPWRNMWEVAVGPGGNGNNPLSLIIDGNDPANKELAFPAAQFAYESGQYAATALTFDPKKNAVRVRFLDPVTREARYDAWLSQEG